MRQERCAVSLDKGLAASQRELAGAPVVVVVAPLCSGSSGAKRRLSPGVPEQGAPGATRRESVHLIWGMVSPLCSGPPGARRRARMQLDVHLPPSSSSRRFVPRVPEQGAAMFWESRSKARKRSRSNGAQACSSFGMVSLPCSGPPGARRRVRMQCFAFRRRRHRRAALPREFRSKAPPCSGSSGAMRESAAWLRKSLRAGDSV